MTNQLIDNIAIPTFVLNQQGVISHWNQALTQLTGLTGESMVGTQDQWRPFYGHSKPTMADLIIQGSDQESIDTLNYDNYRSGDILAGAYAAEDFFPEVGDDGEWLSFTASPIHDDQGTVVGAIETLVNISDRKKAELELIQREQLYRELSITDELTQLYNRRFFFQELSREMASSKRYHQPLSLCMLDLDHFKIVNDNHGHLFGDRILAEFGKLMKQYLRTTDSGFRYGGEEFTILMPSIDDATIPADRIRQAWQQQTFTTDSGEEVAVSVSVGVTAYVSGDDETSLLNRVDQAMYRSKQMGRNRVTVVTG